MVVYANPNTDGAVVNFKSCYEHFIGGEWVPPAKGQYFENPSPVTGQTFCEIARGTAEDIEAALDAAHKAAPTWNKSSPTERAALLLTMADRMEENLEKLAVADAWDNGKAVRETLNADRKSTRLNSSHVAISYAVFCLTQKKKINRLQ